MTQPQAGAPHTAQSMNRLVQADRSLISKDAVQTRQRWGGPATVNADFSLTLDEDPTRSKIYTYAVMDPLTLSLGMEGLDTATAQTWITTLQSEQNPQEATLETFDTGSEGDALNGRVCLEAGLLTHSHAFALPAQFLPPQPGDRVAVMIYHSRSNDQYDAGSITEFWVLGRLRYLDYSPGSGS